jgi:hypothetical protein
VHIASIQDLLLSGVPVDENDCCGNQGSAQDDEQHQSAHAEVTACAYEREFNFTLFLVEVVAIHGE